MTLHEAGLEAALLPCPFCNSTNLIRSEGERRDDGLAGAPASIICIGCDGRMFGYDLQKAAAAWNRRASLPAPQGPALARYGQAIDQWLQCLEGAGTWDARTLERVRICIGPILDEMIASTPAPQGPVAQVSEPGFVLVPVEPTEAMMEALAVEAERQHLALDEFSDPIYPAKLYSAMLAAAPQPTSPDTGAQGAEPVQPVATIEIFDGRSTTYVEEGAFALPDGKYSLYLAQPQASREAIIEECAKAVQTARTAAIHSADVSYVEGVAEGHRRSENAIRALQRKQTP